MLDPQLLLAAGAARPPLTVTGIATAIATVVIALTALVGALTGFFRVLPTLRHTKTIADQTLAEAQATHKIVNQQRTDGLRYNRALVDALRQAGIAVPVDQSLNDEPPAPLTPQAAD